MSESNKEEKIGGRKRRRRRRRNIDLATNRRNMERIIMENEITRYCYGLHDRIDPYDCRIVSGREG